MTLLAIVGDPGTVEPTVDAVTYANGSTVVRWSAATTEPHDPPAAGTHPFVVVGLVEHKADEIRFERVSPRVQ